MPTPQQEDERKRQLLFPLANGAPQTRVPFAGRAAALQRLSGAPAAANPLATLDQQAPVVRQPFAGRAAALNRLGDTPSFGDSAAVTTGAIPFSTNLPKVPSTIQGQRQATGVPSLSTIAAAPAVALGEAAERSLGLPPEAQRRAQTQSRTPPDATSVAPVRLPNDPSAAGNQPGTVVVPPGTRESLSKPVPTATPTAPGARPIFRNAQGTNFSDQQITGGVNYAPGALPGTRAVPQQNANIPIQRGDAAALRATQEQPQQIARGGGTTSFLNTSQEAAENQKFLDYRANDPDRLKRQAYVAQRTAEGKATQADAPFRSVREAAGRTLEALGRKGSQVDRNDLKLQAGLTQTIADLAPQPAEKTASAEELAASNADTGQAIAQTALAEGQALAAQQNNAASQKKQALRENLLAQLDSATPEQQRSIIDKVLIGDGKDPNADAFEMVKLGGAQNFDGKEADSAISINKRTGEKEFITSGGQAAQVAPPATAVASLKADPKRSADFEAKYGKGSAAQYLGG